MDISAGEEENDTKKMEKVYWSWDGEENGEEKRSSNCRRGGILNCRLTMGFFAAQGFLGLLGKIASYLESKVVV